MPKKKTHEEFVNEISIKHPNIEILGTYVDSRTHIKCRCKIDGYEWETKAQNLIKGNNCKMCALRKRKTNPCKPKKTNEEFVNELHLKNKNILALDNYEGYHKKIHFKCLLDGFIFEKTPASMIQNPNCPKCSKKARRTHEDFVLEVNEKFDNIEILSEFSGVDNPIECKCNIHNIEWTTTPFTLLKGNFGCKLCANEGVSKMKTKTTNEFSKEIKDITKGEYVVCGEYINSRTPILLRHTKCNHTFKMRPSNFLIYQSCPHCITPTRGEKKIIDYFSNNNINYEFQKYYDDLRGINDGLLSYDFYLKDYNTLIEYQGQFHDGLDNEYVAENLNRQQEHDRRKRQYAKDHNIKLLEIWYWDFENIEEILSRELGLVA